jgi:hypothetical protein
VRVSVGVILVVVDISLPSLSDVFADPEVVLPASATVSSLATVGLLGLLVKIDPVVVVPVNGDIGSASGTVCNFLDQY